MKRLTSETKLTIQVIISIILILAGLTLLYLGFYAEPHGDISNSVLVAYGETSSFAGALLGIDYTYKYRVQKLDYENRKDKEINDEN